MVLLMIYVNPISLFLHTFVGMLRNHCTSVVLGLCPAGGCPQPDPESCKGKPRDLD